MLGLHENVLSVGIGGSNWKYVRDAQSYVSFIARTETRPPNYWVSEDGLTYTVGRYSLTMDVLRSGIQDAYRELESLFQEIVGERNFHFSMKDLVDDISNTTRGYSFLSEAPFAARKHDLFLHVLKEKKLAKVDAQGNFAWNKPAMRRWLLITAKFWRIVAWLLSITAQVSTRLAQFMEITLCNADHLRSIIIQAGEMILLLRNHKASHLTERDGWIPAFVPPFLAKMIARALLMGLREAECIMIYHECGREASEIHRT